MISTDTPNPKILDSTTQPLTTRLWDSPGRKPGLTGQEAGTHRARDRARADQQARRRSRERAGRTIAFPPGPSG